MTKDKRKKQKLQAEGRWVQRGTTQGRPGSSGLPRPFVLPLEGSAVASFREREARRAAVVRMKLFIVLLAWIFISFGVLAFSFIAAARPGSRPEATLLLAFYAAFAACGGVVLIVRRMLLVPMAEISRKNDMLAASELNYRTLAAEKEFSEAIFNSTASGVAVLDENGKVLRMNQSGLEMIELSARDVEGRHIGSINAGMEEMKNINPNLNREFNVETKDGRVKPIGFTSSPLLDHDGRQKGTIVVFRDLTEIKKLRAEINKKQHFESMGKVMAGVAHEIRNPLFAIQAIGQILEREMPSPRHQGLVSAMLKETGRMKALIEDLLFYSRPSRLEVAAVDVDFFFEEIVNSLRLNGYQPRVSFSCPAPMRINADGNKMRQVFLNLVDNAAGASCSQVEIRAERKNGAAVITVRDDGEVIAEADMERIFDPFFTTKKEGTGLGLSICRKIVEDHGGRMEIKSARGAGTTVTVSLPSC